jgi:hypothetical protein
MFTPELSNEKEGVFKLVSNHELADPKARQLSIDYNLARIRYAWKHVPPQFTKCVLVYDIRGQHVSTDAIAQLKSSFAHIHKLEFMT